MLAKVTINILSRKKESLNNILVRNFLILKGFKMIVRKKFKVI